MPKIELKPCPFCDSTDIESYVEGFVRTYVECKTCGAKEAKELWNRRAPNEH